MASWGAAPWQTYTGIGPVYITHAAWGFLNWNCTGELVAVMGCLGIRQHTYAVSNAKAGIIFVRGHVRSRPSVRQ